MYENQRYRGTRTHRAKKPLKKELRTPKWHQREYLHLLTAPLDSISRLAMLSTFLVSATMAMPQADVPLVTRIGLGRDSSISALLGRTVVFSARQTNAACAIVAPTWEPLFASASQKLGRNRCDKSARLMYYPCDRRAPSFRQARSDVRWPPRCAPALRRCAPIPSGKSRTDRAKLRSGQDPAPANQSGRARQFHSENMFQPDVTACGGPVASDTRGRGAR